MRAALILILVAGCGNDGKVEACEPTNACSCTDGTQRDTACTCSGGATCSISGDSIEFTCDGNAACNLDCGTNCLITCPGTTTCTVEVGDDAVVTCPGTALCDVLCHGDCTINKAGNADAIMRCEHEADGSVCMISGCTPTSCGNGVYACGAACP
jgi:hypothetical protein